jgi:hypothetical protein
VNPPVLVEVDVFVPAPKEGVLFFVVFGIIIMKTTVFPWFRDTTLQHEFSAKSIL